MTSRFRTIDDIMEVTTKPIIFDGDTGGLAEHFAGGPDAGRGGTDPPGPGPPGPDSSPHGRRGTRPAGHRMENRTVYMCFSTDILHSGHIAIIKKARGNAAVGLQGSNCALHGDGFSQAGPTQVGEGQT